MAVAGYRENQLVETKGAAEMKAQTEKLKHRNPYLGRIRSS
jgi:hypothetical protein